MSGGSFGIIWSTLVRTYGSEPECSKNVVLIVCPLLRMVTVYSVTCEMLKKQAVFAAEAH